MFSSASGQVRSTLSPHCIVVLDFGIPLSETNDKWSVWTCNIVMSTNLKYLVGRLLNLCIGESFRIPGMTYSKLILRMDVLGVESFRRSQSEPLERDINHARYDYDKLRVHSMAIFPWLKSPNCKNDWFNNVNTELWCRCPLEMQGYIQHVLRALYGKSGIFSTHSKTDIVGTLEGEEVRGTPVCPGKLSWLCQENLEDTFHEESLYCNSTKLFGNNWEVALCSHF